MRTHRYLFIYFALGIFIMYGCAEYFAQLSAGITAAGYEYIIYAVSCLIAAFGVCLYIPLRKMAKSIKKGIVVLGFIATSIMLGLTGFIHTQAMFFSILSLFFMVEGLNMAICAYYLHRLIRTGTKVGVPLAGASIAGLTATYVLNFISVPVYVKSILFATCILVMMFIAFRKINLLEILEPQDDESKTDKNRDNRKKLFLPIVLTISAATAVMSYLIGVNDMVIYKALLSGVDIMLFTYQSLLYLPGILIAGIIADVKEGRFLPVATLGCTLIAAPIAIFTVSPDIYTVYSGITYFLGGFYLIYIMTGLTSVAYKTKKPSLIIVLAALIFFLFSALGAYTSGLYIQADNILPLFVYIVLSAILLMTFFLSGSLQLGLTKQSIDEAFNLFIPDIEAHAENYGFTARETEALLYLLNGYQNMDIAEKMMITENTVYKYISSMIIKSGAKSRVGLITMFSTQKNGHGSFVK